MERPDWGHCNVLGTTDAVRTGKPMWDAHAAQKLGAGTRSARSSLPLLPTLRTPRNVLVQSRTGKICVISAPAQFVRLLAARILQFLIRRPRPNLFISQFSLLIARHYMILRNTPVRLTVCSLTKKSECCRSGKHSTTSACTDHEPWLVTKSEQRARVAALRMRDTPDVPGSSATIGRRSWAASAQAPSARHWLHSVTALARLRLWSILSVVFAQRSPECSTPSQTRGRKFVKSVEPTIELEPMACRLRIRCGESL